MKASTLMWTFTLLLAMVSPLLGLYTYFEEDAIAIRRNRFKEASRPIITTDNLRIVSRDEWNAQRVNSTIPNFKVQPVSRLLLSQKRTRNCFNVAACAEIMRSIQYNDTTIAGYKDIAANFYIGNDGTVFEARGWDTEGPEDRKTEYHERMEFVFFGAHKRSRNLTEALTALIYTGVAKGKLTISNYGVDTEV